MCVPLTVNRISKGENKNRRINKGYVIALPSILMKKKAKPKRNVPSVVIF